MKPCPFPDCTRDVNDVDLCCPKHWQQLPHAYRFSATTALREHLREEITLETLRARQSAVIRDAIGYRAEATYRPRVVRCRCGRDVLVAMCKEGDLGEVTLDVATVATAPHCLVVIGGCVEWAHGNRGCYTRYTPHTCQEISDGTEAAPAPA